MKVTLGSRVDGRGHFLTMPTTFGKETQHSVTIRTEIDTLQSYDTAHATRRDFYEQPSIVYPTPAHGHGSGADEITALPRVSTYEGPYWEHIGTDEKQTTKDNTSKRTKWLSPWRTPKKTGYWDVVSVLNSRANSRGPEDGNEEKALQHPVFS